MVDKELISKPVEFSPSHAEVAKALGHPTRLKILEVLVQRKACICGDIVEDLGLPQSTVSQHLKLMKNAGLIRGEVDGPRVCYCLDWEVWSDFAAFVRQIQPSDQECCS